MTAAEYYAARVDAVLAQRARLRGAEPSAMPSALSIPTIHCSKPIRTGRSTPILRLSPI